MSDDQPQQSTPSEQQEWVPVAPPHPYNQDSSATSDGRQGKVLSIIAMALGLTALLTIAVSVAYFNSAMAIVSGIAGIVAIVLGVVALVKRFKPTGASIAGVAAGALATIVVTALMGLGALTAASQESDTQRGEAWTPGTEQQQLVEWPANMSTGGIVFEGPGTPHPQLSAPLAAGNAPTPLQVDRGARTDILVYVDYRCPHCGAFEQKNNAYLTDLLAQGNATVEVVPLSFMDRMSEGTAYSSRAAGALACMTDTQPEAAWAAHSTLLSAEVQPGAGPGLTNDQIITALDAGVGGLTSESRTCITAQKFAPFAKALNEWVFQNPVPNTVEPNIRLEGTPTVFVNGVMFTGNPDDATAFRSFVEEQGH